MSNMKYSDKLDELLQGKKLLIFDFDGTVADTSPLHAAAFSAVLAPYDIRVDYPSIAGLSTKDAMRQCIEAAGHTLDAITISNLVAGKQKYVRELIAKSLVPMPGVDNFLRWARSHYQLAMVTSGSRGTVGLALEKLGYSDWFHPLICADDVQRAKPDPEGFLAVLARTGVPSEQALVFEDSFSGMAAAAAAKIDCCDVGTGIFVI